MTRKIMTALVVLSISALAAFAGEKHGAMGGMDPAAHAAKLKAELSLSDAVTVQVENIFADSFKKMGPARERMRAAHGGGSTDTAAGAVAANPGKMEALRAEMHAVFAERDAALKQILTTEQFAQFKEISAAHAKMGMGGGHGHGGGGHGAGHGGGHGEGHAK